MALRCFISTSSFGKQSPLGLEQLHAHGMEVTLNPFGRKLRKRETVELYSKADVVIAGVEDIDQEVLDANPQLKVISRCGIGVDSIDLEAVKLRKISLLTTPEPPAQAVAELTIGLIFSAARRIAEADAGIRRKEWKSLMGCLLKDKTLGILGFGRVGRKVAQVFGTLGMKLAVYDPFPNHDLIREVGATAADLKTVLSTSDVVTLHMPLNPHTKGLLNAERFALLKKGAIIVNTSRGGIIDEAVLAEYLGDGRLSGAALDVFENEPYEGPLLSVPNVVLTSHMGSYAAETRIAMEIEATSNLISECLKLNLLP